MRAKPAARKAETAGPTTMPSWAAEATRESAAADCFFATTSVTPACATGMEAANTPARPRERMIAVTEGESAMRHEASVAPARHPRSTTVRPTRVERETISGQHTICMIEKEDVAIPT
eukprot:CAMPEP_0180274290 /NCGR_PEP_ID=MMETSP0988-20121125/5248_1 /TAXON_ID=697907 /ORGANISM="non described non described, Strain CCMP2293" /LENGTH=117 /DNA_ID=CAMNT_0022245515 /DNA_START=649 /DNA_END=1002 /DNA_ORIENTATION=-